MGVLTQERDCAIVAQSTRSLRRNCPDQVRRVDASTSQP